MTKLRDLTLTPSPASLSPFKLPGWVRADNIRRLIDGALSSDDESDSEEDTEGKNQSRKSGARG